jgi:hypothetical protein
MKRRVKTISRAGRTVAKVAVGSVREIRRALTVEGDIRSDVQFQNDVNAILAIVGKLTALGPGAEEPGEDVSIDVTPLPEASPARPIPSPVPLPARARRARVP